MSRKPQIQIAATAAEGFDLDAGEIQALEQDIRANLDAGISELDALDIASAAVDQGEALKRVALALIKGEHHDI